MTRKVWILDTTLRDGEQVPGAKLDVQGKLMVARQLKKLNVDIIEAGFPSSSPGDFQAVSEIARQVGDGKTTITALARAVKKDIDSVYQAVKQAERPLIHIVLGTSNIHVEKKFCKSKDEILAMGVESVAYAKKLLPEVQYSTEDASRSEFAYLWKTIESVIRAGATIINIPDTVGYAVPEEFGDLVYRINERIKNMDDRVKLSIHCHNDTGLAVANSLIAIKNGADKVECTINGLGERAGNAALEEIVMGLKVRSDYYQCHTDIITQEIKNTSELISGLMGIEVQVNKAITGSNAFAHSSGIHQDGLLKSRDSYEIIDPKDVGVEDMALVLTARSGRHAFKNAISKYGYEIAEEDFSLLFEEFLEMADRKSEVYDHDLIYLLEEYSKEYGYGTQRESKELSQTLYQLEHMQVMTNDSSSSAAIRVRQGNVLKEASIYAEGPVDALFSALKQITGLPVELKDYRINSMTKGKDALGNAAVKLLYKNRVYHATAKDRDILKASALAYLNVINTILMEDVTHKQVM